jgi:hypothetical protein
MIVLKKQVCFINIQHVICLVEDIRNFLVNEVKIADKDATSYATKLVTQNIRTVDELLSLRETDLRDPAIGMLLGDLNRLRPKLKGKFY